MEALNELNEMLNKNDEKGVNMLKSFSNIYNLLKENVSTTIEHISNNKELDLTFLQNQLHKLKNLKSDSNNDDENEDDTSTTSTQTKSNVFPKTSETNSKENEPPSEEVQSNKTTTRSSRSRAVVKKEKMSVAPLQVISENIKSEREEMPPPAVPEKKVNKKKELKVIKKEPKTRLRSAFAKKSQDSDRSSDVIIETPSIETLNISDDDPVPEVPKIRVTRSKALKKPPAKTKKRNSSASPEVVIKSEPKRAKHHTDEKDKSVYEDAICRASTESLKEQMAKQEKHTVVLLKPLSKESIRASKQVENCNVTCTVSSDTNRSIINETIDIPPKSVPDANATYVKPADQREETVHNETYQVAENNATFVKQTDGEKEVPSKFIDDLMTDDESEEEVATPPPKKAFSKKDNKAIFDYENSPIKKRVEAFEKLATQVSEIPVRQTRTRTNEATANKGKATLLSSNKYSSATNKKQSTVTTPVNTRKFAPVTLATSKILYRDQTSPLIHTKPLSALKTSTQEYREKQKAQELEAIRKKEALMRAQTEEKRKKREEKEQKVKQAKEAQEREKQQMMEAQKLKEEKHKQLLMEKQEKLQQQKEEAEKKRMHAKLLSQEKKEDERKRQEELRQKLETLEAMKQCKTPTMPIYKTHALPKLPTYDCYDSDDDMRGDSTKRPSWAKSVNREKTLRIMSYIYLKMQNTLFNMKAQSPDLIDILGYISPRKLRRNSSVLWSHDPNFTLMLPGFEEEL